MVFCLSWSFNSLSIPGKQSSCPTPAQPLQQGKDSVTQRKREWNLTLTAWARGPTKQTQAPPRGLRSLAVWPASPSPPLTEPLITSHQVVSSCQVLGHFRYQLLKETRSALCCPQQPPHRPMRVGCQGLRDTRNFPAETFLSTLFSPLSRPQHGTREDFLKNPWPASCAKWAWSSLIAQTWYHYINILAHT